MSWLTRSFHCDNNCLCLPEVASHFPANSFSSLRISTFQFFLNLQCFDAGQFLRRQWDEADKDFSFSNLSSDSSDSWLFLFLICGWELQQPTLFTNAGIKTRLISNRSQQFSWRRYLKLLKIYVAIWQHLARCCGWKFKSILRPHSNMVLKMNFWVYWGGHVAQ